jgi:putative membrane protein
MKKNIFRISIRNSIIISYVIGLFLVIGWTVISAISSIVEYGQVRDIAAGIVAIPLWGGFVAALFIYPIVLAVYQLVMLILETDRIMSKTGVGFDQIVIWYGFILEGLYIAVVKDATGSDWSEVLTNSETHTPIFTGAGLTICVLCFIGLIGYYYLRICSLKKIPPLLAVFSISAMYIWLVVIVIFTVQVFGSGGMVGRYSDLYLLIYPFCIACIIVRTILCKVREWNELEMERGKIQNNVILNFLDKILSNSRLWPIYALVLMLPLLGIIIAILLLFGQAPDSVIKAWTETADWRLSLKEAPQNIYYDEHYLCTVAAGGHKKIVKPIRRGIRHGHEVIVNRQLCIANAFEQILEEKTPRFHKLVRGVYDRYGFPVARLIKSKWIADIIYIMMKPLEWIFLMVIYMNDVQPENRIATQYMGKIKKLP